MDSLCQPLAWQLRFFLADEVAENAKPRPADLNFRPQAKVRIGPGLAGPVEEAECLREVADDRLPYVSPRRCVSTVVAGPGRRHRVAG